MALAFRGDFELLNEGTLDNCAVEVAKPLPDFREGQAGEFLVRRVMPPAGSTAALDVVSLMLAAGNRRDCFVGL
jgi:hypothetical protein